MYQLSVATQCCMTSNRNLCSRVCTTGNTVLMVAQLCSSQLDLAFSRGWLQKAGLRRSWLGRLCSVWALFLQQAGLGLFSLAGAGSRRASRANKVQRDFCRSKLQGQAQIYPLPCEFAFVCKGYLLVINPKHLS